LLAGCAAEKGSDNVGSKVAVNGEDALVSEVPMTATASNSLESQIAKEWTLGSLAGSPEIEGKIAELRISLSPAGDVTKVVWLNESADPAMRGVAESCMRAVKRSSPIEFPPGQYWPTIKLRCNPEAIE
jgi:hypothetical protein